jgi:hypothetical protein
VRRGTHAHATRAPTPDHIPGPYPIAYKRIRAGRGRGGRHLALLARQRRPVLLPPVAAAAAPPAAGVTPAGVRVAAAAGLPVALVVAVVVAVVAVAGLLAVLPGRRLAATPPQRRPPSKRA